MKSVFSSKGKLNPHLLEVVKLIKSRINTLPELKTLAFDPKSTDIHSNLNKDEFFIINEFYQAEGFRKIHLEVAKLGKSFQILHCVFFPDPCYELPIFGVDLVFSFDNISAAIVDLSPVWDQLPNFLSSKMELLEFPKFKEPRRLPDWGYIFSPYACFIRPVDLHEEKLFIKLVDQYLSLLLPLLMSSEARDLNSLDTIKRYEFQKRYCLNQKRNDKTRVILSKFFGSSWAEEYINKVLFEC